MQTGTILAVIQRGYGLKSEAVSENNFIIYNIIYSNTVKSMKAATEGVQLTDT